MTGGPARTDELLRALQDRTFRRTDRLFAWLMIAQWLCACGYTLWSTPFTWSGATRSVHPHVLASVLLGGILTSLPVLFVRTYPGAPRTRHVVAIAQMLWSALLIHVTGGRLETHFHVFGSLAFLAFYRDWRILPGAVLTIAIDHFVRGALWPESVYGLRNPEWWRFLEHGGWVVFEAVFLVIAVRGSEREMRQLAIGQAEIEQRTGALAVTNAELERRMHELKRTQDQLLLADRLSSLGRVAASIGHEINNPLSYVVSNLDELSRVDGLAPEARELIDEARDGSERVRRIVGDLKSIARASSGRRDRVDLHATLESTIRMASNELRHRGRLIRDYGEVPAIHGDASRLGQVFLNLIVNAIQALTGTRDGGHFIAIRTSTRPGGDAVVEIEDSGEGIPADRIPLLFDPFFTTKAVGVGTGLGLSICHSIVAEHGGTVEVDSVPGQGSRFRVILPALGHANPAPLPVPRTRELPLGEPRRSVLLIDDDARLLRSLKRSLARHHDIEACEGATPALALLAAGRRFDAILCDLHMPDITGMEFYHRLTEGFPGMERIVIFMTGGAFTAEATRFARECPNPSVEKPVDLAEILRLIRHIAAPAKGTSEQPALAPPATALDC